MDSNIQLDDQIKKLLELIQQLKREDIEAFKQHIDHVRQSSDIQILPYLVEMLGDEHVDEEKKDAILNLIMDVKHPEAVKLLVNGLKYLSGKEELQPYLEALWQNSLSFASYLDTFVGLVLSEDYLTAYDAFTIIENSASDASSKDIEAAIAKLKDGLNSQNDDKKPMVVELINVLDDLRNLPAEE